MCEGVLCLPSPVPFPSPPATLPILWVCGGWGVGGGRWGVEGVCVCVCVWRRCELIKLSTQIPGQQSNSLARFKKKVQIYI